MMNDPIDHHYLPVFYLKRWCGAEGKVVRFYRPHDRVIASPITPANTGFEPRLYTLEGYPPEQQQVIEKNYFGPAVDSPAALATEVLIGRDRSKLTVELRTVFTRFLMSMQLRNPHTLQEVKAVAEKALQVNLTADPHGEYEAIRKPGDPPTLYEWALKHAPAQMENIHKAWLPGLVDHEKIGEHIMNMHWTVFDVSQGRFPLLTADRPFLTSHGLGDPQAVLAFPISPRDLFIASNSPDAVRRFQAQGMTETARRVNDQLARLAVKYVYGDTDRALAFVEARLIARGESPVPGVIGRDPSRYESTPAK